ncbi:hypothetical protein vseg_003446 [Gypsophila vaccaria]
MGTKKFKLSDMIPNAWFHKLKYMNTKSSKKFKNHHLPPPPPPPAPPSSTVKTPPRPDPQCQSRKSYHVSRELTIDQLPNELDTLLLLHNSPPRKSKSSAKSKKSNRRSSSISTCSCQSSSTFQSYRSKYDRSPPSPPSPKETGMKDAGFLAEDALLGVKQTGSRSANKLSIVRNARADDKDKHHHRPEHFDIDIDVDVDRASLLRTDTDNDTKFDIQLPPIITTKQKPKPKPHVGMKMTINSPGGVRLKMNSPRIVGRKQGQNGHKNVGRKSISTKKRRSISESFAVVKSSFDPQRDFKESMLEMILQNNLTAAKDLEDLLACYLSLNSDEYHGVIIEVFKQIWNDLRHHK